MNSKNKFDRYAANCNTVFHNFSIELCLGYYASAYIATA